MMIDECCKWLGSARVKGSAESRIKKNRIKSRVKGREGQGRVKGRVEGRVKGK